jgi:uncharacterized damage-inducible protein DinB
MDPKGREYLKVDIHPSRQPEIGRWLWALQDTRRRTLKGLDGLTQAVIDWLPENVESSAATILYHIANIEADWLYAEVLEQPFPAEVEALFQYGTRDGQGNLSQVIGMSLEHHLQTLKIVRSLLLDVFEAMDLDEFRRARTLEPYDVTPEWVLHHLMQHEAEHRSQIGAVRARAERELGSR